MLYFSAEQIILKGICKMMNLGNNNLYNGQQQGMVQYAQPQQQYVMNQLLTAEEQDSLRTEKPEFSGKLSKKEYLRAICTHKDIRTGNFSLSYNEHEDTHTCAICGETFHLIDLNNYTPDQITQVCSDFNDLFQSIKTMYGGVPTEAGRDLYMIGGYIKKFPAMFEYAANYFRKLDIGNGLQRAGSGQNQQMLQMFTALMTPGMAPNMMATPNYGGPVAPPAAWGQAAAPMLTPQQQWEKQQWEQQQAAQARTVAPGWGQAAAPAPGWGAAPGAGMFGGGETPVGFVDPTGSTPPVVKEEKVASPDVKGAFKG